MGSSTLGSIFAYELQNILQEQKQPLSLSDLKRNPFSLDGKKVNRLVASLQRDKELPGLDQADFHTIVLGLNKLGSKISFTSEECLRMYAALVALGVQRLMRDYLASERAWTIANEVRCTRL